LLRLDKQGRSARECFGPRLGAVVASFPRELVWIFYPLLAARVSLEKGRHFFFGKLAAIRPRVSFGDAVTLLKLDQSNIFPAWVLVHVCCHALFIRRAGVNGLSEKRADLLLGLAEARKGLAAQAKHDRGC